MKDRAWSTLSVLRLRRDGHRPPAAAPSGGSGDRVFIGPANSAGQGFAWARALEQARPGTRVTSMQFVHEVDGFAYPVDQRVLSGYGAHSKRWQRDQLAALRGYRGVLAESARPLFGALHGGDLVRQLAVLHGSGVRLGLLFHGSDLRDPDAHLAAEPLSYFGPDPEFTEAMRAATRRSREVIAETGLPVHVSTPDLLSEIEGAVWTPVVVDAAKWAAARAPLAHEGPMRVVHAPSKSHVKGSDLIDGTLQRMHDAGRIEYRRITGVPHDRMPEITRDADVVLDQFRGGPYGVAACEAMAAGRIVVSYVPRTLRDRVSRITGLELPIIDAVPDSLEDVLQGIVRDPGPALAAAAAGPGYVEELHSGARSGRVLAEWLDGGE